MKLETNLRFDLREEGPRHPDVLLDHLLLLEVVRGVVGPELLGRDDLRDDEVLVELQQPGVLRQRPVLVLQLLVDLPLEPGQQLHQLVLHPVPVRHLRRLTLRVDEVEVRAVAVVEDDLELDLGLALRADLLGLDLGVLVGHGEVALVPRHPPDPL